MIQVYFGNGKGKTTAAVGSAIRFAGCGNKVLIAEFLKDNNSAEYKILQKIDGIQILFADEHYNLFDNLDESRTKALSGAYSKLLFEDVKSKADPCGMIILDEILDAIDFGYIDEDKFLEFIDSFRESTEIVLTGHKYLKKIADASDYVSEVKEIKHPYTKGVSPREGIEF